MVVQLSVLQPLEVKELGLNPTSCCSTFDQSALGVWTLHKVLGQKGASITVPCHYDPKYKDNTKYWCRGYQWATCLVMARSTSTQSGGKVSIRDESSQQLFIVTMRNLTERDTNKYWCAVKIGSIVKPDVKASVFLTVTAGSVGLSVLDNMVAGVAGDSVTVRCFYRDRYALSPRKWCRSSDWGSCVTAGEARANRVLISDNGTGVFAVTLKALTEKDQGWYWCASGDAQVPIHITVMAPATGDMKSSCEMEEIVTNLTVDVEDESNHTDPDVVL
ncbi:hypothetical protein Z043_122996 [Scleropages formosus]|uniref:Ig-like domain-containing protein n=1 Tax=Scleropages formosus TaxID=113540 RepID=A0A0P7W8F4_SCLFO|nr:hypothetical protein Z043_122996 [Scleropages formosus]